MEAIPHQSPGKCQPKHPPCRQSQSAVEHHDGHQQHSRSHIRERPDKVLRDQREEHRYEQDEEKHQTRYVAGINLALFRVADYDEHILKRGKVHCGQDRSLSIEFTNFEFFYGANEDAWGEYPTDTRGKDSLTRLQVGLL